MSNGTEVIRRPVEGSDLAVAQFMPLLTMDQALQRRQIIVEATQRLMTEGVDYGKIPGCDRPCLLQPGADKLDNLFGLTVEYEVREEIKDWLGRDHGGEPFFYYEVLARAKRQGFLMGEGIGSCNSWEAKYRWRTQERTCPNCGKATIFKSKQEPGWFCWAKKGGCGAKFPPGSLEIESQEVGRKANPDVFDLVNTVQKIAFKRAKVAVTINATSASEFFTQDMEDLQPVVQAEVQTEERRPAAEEQSTGVSEDHGPDPETAALWKRMATKTACIEVLQEQKRQLLEVMGPGGETEYYRVLAKYGVAHANLFTTGQPARLAARDLLAILNAGKELRAYQGSDANA